MALKDEINAFIDNAIKYGPQPKELVVPPCYADKIEEIQQMIGIPVVVAKLPQVATLNDYLKQPFKDATIADYWYTFDRSTRREIERLVKKGKNPDIMKYI